MTDDCTHPADAARKLTADDLDLIRTALHVTLNTRISDLYHDLESVVTVGDVIEFQQRCEALIEKMGGTA